MIYLWKTPLKFLECIDGDDLCRYIGLYNRDKGPDSALLNNGHMEAKLWFWSKAELEFKFEASVFELLAYDVLENSAHLIIVNKRVKLVLEAFAENDLQFAPVTIICSNGNVDGYNAINILSRVAGIDKQKSTIEWGSVVGSMPYIEGFGCGIGVLVYNHDCLGKHHIALEKEFNFTLISQELKDALCALAPPVKEVSFVLPENTEW